MKASRWIFFASLAGSFLFKNKTAKSLFTTSAAVSGAYSLADLWTHSENDISLQGMEKKITHFSNKRIRSFIAYEESEKQIFREELALFQHNEISSILRKLIEFSIKPQLIYPDYKKFNQFEFNFGRLRIGDFRIFVHKIDNENFLMLRIFRKTTKKTPANETKLAYSRLIRYINNN